MIWCSPCRVTTCAIKHFQTWFTFPWSHGHLESHAGMIIANSNKTSSPPCPGPKIHSKWVSCSDMERDERATMCMCLRRPKENNVFVFVNVDTQIFICFCPSHRQQAGHATSTTVMAYKIFRRIGTRRRELLVAALQHLVWFSLAIFGRVESLSIVSNMDDSKTNAEACDIIANDGEWKGIVIPCQPSEFAFKLSDVYRWIMKTTLHMQIVCTLRLLVYGMHAHGLYLEQVHVVRLCKGMCKCADVARTSFLEWAMIPKPVGCFNERSADVHVDPCREQSCIFRRYLYTMIRS